MKETIDQICLFPKIGDVIFHEEWGVVEVLYATTLSVVELVQDNGGIFFYITKGI